MITDFNCFEMKINKCLLLRIIIVVFLFASISSTIKAQTIIGSDKEWTGKETKEEAWRKKIDMDMSVPDFKSNKVNQEVMGWRVAKMIDYLQKYYHQASYNRQLSLIRYEQTEDPKIRFAGIDKLTFINAEKRDSVFLIKWHTYTRLEDKEKINHNITMEFINGVSNSDTINDLFSDISRFIKPDDE